MDKKVKAITQVTAPNTKLLKSVHPIVSNPQERIYRPAQKVSTLIKRGLIDGVRASDSLGEFMYDDAEGRCPSALRIDADKFDIATTMMRNGDSSKNVTRALLELSSEE